MIEFLCIDCSARVDRGDFALCAECDAALHAWMEALMAGEIKTIKFTKIPEWN